MLFNSIAFAIFLPIVFCIYWVVPHRFRCSLLLIASYYFYMSWTPKYVVLILLTTIVSYGAALLLEKCQSKAGRRWILIGSLIICLGVLFVFKYFNFFTESIANILSIFSLTLHPITLSLVLPVGISFYTFQTLSYVIDVYKGNITAEKNFGIYATFVSFFPQLVAGPIERTSNLLPQIKKEHKFDYDQAMEGVKLMLIGYYKKLVIADVIGPYVDVLYADVQSYQGFDMVVAIFFFTIQIYCDFSGYSDIAIGTAKLMGINLMTNFRSPYFSKSIKEFWSRWHISLSTWFKDYVYIPLGGNRCSKCRRNLNLLITFLVSGLWHGANWTFVLWGAMHGIAQIIENTLDKVLKKFRNNIIGKGVSVFAVFCFCNIAWVFFRAENFSQAIYVLSHVFTGISNPKSYFQTSLGMSVYHLILYLGCILLLAIYDYFNQDGTVLIKISLWKKGFQWALYIVIGLMVVFLSQKGVAAEFVYFQF